MKTIALNNKKLLLLVTFLSSIYIGFGQEIASFSSLADNACSGVIDNDVNLTATGVCRGPGIGIDAGGTYNSNDWTTAATIDTDDYLEWTITPNAGYQVDLTTMDISYDRGGQGPTNAEIQVDAGSGYVTVFTDPAVAAGSEENDGIDLTAFTNITGTITFRLYAFNANSAAGTFAIEEHNTYLLNKGIIVNGTVTSTCASTVTWDGANWTPAGPIDSSEVIIDGLYDTAAQVSFEACSLTITSNGVLRISNGDYVSVVNDITIDAGGDLLVRDKGSVVQLNDNAIANVGTATVEKRTAWLNKWYEYTYWSSPVSNETIGNALFESDSDRRFWFSAIDFVDSEGETDNDGNPQPGVQDDIDDNGNDWRLANSADIMTPGVGYAATHSEAFFTGPPPGTPPFQFLYYFEGTLNNGPISVPVARNDTEMADTNWNFIGNPYPSAISVDDFFVENNYDATTNPDGILTGAIYIWSQDSPPSDTNNGNESQNFSTDDYAIINELDELPGGDNNNDGVIDAADTPSRYIPSGQGFFVAYSNDAVTASDNVTFNNSMRVIDNNTQFFRQNSNITETNKLKLSVTSNNGISNLLSICYAQGATNLYDGMRYDAPRNLASGAGAIIYSIIEDSPRKFAIQGRDINSMNINDIIPIGIKSTINSEIQYTMSIAELEGEFVNNNTIFLRDNLLNIEHNLSDSDYNFTLGAGEYNSRFEIFFSGTLSVDEFDLDSDELIISDNGDNSIEITTKDKSQISNIKIYDLLGRELFDVEGNNKTLVRLNTSSLSNSVFILNVSTADRKNFTKKFLNQ